MTARFHVNVIGVLAIILCLQCVLLQICWNLLPFLLLLSLSRAVSDFPDQIVMLRFT